MNLMLCAIGEVESKYGQPIPNYQTDEEAWEASRAVHVRLHTLLTQPFLLEKLPLSNRAQHVVDRQGWKTVFDVLKVDHRERSRTPGLGCTVWGELTKGIQQEWGITLAAWGDKSA